VEGSSDMKRAIRGARAIAIWSIALALSVAPVSARAQTTASPSPSASSGIKLTGDDYESVCSPILTQAAPTHEGDLALYNQKLPICQGAKASYDAMKAQGLLWKVWAGVGAVCAAACGASFAGVGSQYICIGTNVAAGVTEGAVTHDFSAAMNGIMGAGSSFLVNTVMSGGKKEAAEAGEKAAEAPADDAAKKAKEGKESEKDIGACVSALMAAGQAVSKYKSAESAEETLNAAMDELSALTSTSTAAPLPASYSISTGEVTSASSVGTQTSATGSGESTSESGGSETNCASSVATTGEAVSCAAAIDSGLPGFVSNPKFQKEFEKAAREPFGDFLGREGSGIGEAIGGSMGGVLTDAARTKVEAAVEALAAETRGRSDPNVADTIYGGGGRGSKRGGGGGGDDMMGQMAGLMSQLLPNGKKKDGKPDQAFEAAFRVQQAAKGRSPASLAEDRSLSLFDRVTVRYQLLTRADRVGVVEQAGVPIQGGTR
jgi:hypothetical protein